MGRRGCGGCYRNWPCRHGPSHFWTKQSYVSDFQILLVASQARSTERQDATVPKLLTSRARSEHLVTVLGYSLLLSSTRALSRRSASGSPEVPVDGPRGA